MLSTASTSPARRPAPSLKRGLGCEMSATRAATTTFLMSVMMIYTRVIAVDESAATVGMAAPRARTCCAALSALNFSSSLPVIVIRLHSLDQVPNISPAQAALTVKGPFVPGTLCTCGAPGACPWLHAKTAVEPALHAAGWWTTP